MKRIIISLIALFLAAGLQAADASKGKRENENTVASLTIAGKVVDENTGELLAGVAVELEGTGMKTYTDFNGYFEIKNLQPGSYKLSTSMISYQSEQIEGIEVSKEGGKSLKVRMKNLSSR